MEGRLDHTSVAVSDIDAGIEFFTKAFGCVVVFLERGMTKQIASIVGSAGESCDIVQLTLPGSNAKLELIAFSSATGGNPHSRPVAPGMGHLAFQVEDFNAVLGRITALGGRPLGQVTQFNDGKAVYLSTPFGAYLELEELPAGEQLAKTDPVKS